MRYPILYQANARLWLDGLSHQLGRQATLDDIPDEGLIRLAEKGFDWLYLLCVWKTGEIEAQIAQAQPSLQQEAGRVLGIAGNQAICASCFAISGYQAPEAWGGQAALQRLRDRMHRQGLRLMLDFIPNHTGISHPWAKSNPEFYVSTNLESPQAEDGAYLPVQTNHGLRMLAHGRDPFFPPWNDTLQLNYANPELQEAMRHELLLAASVCDGLRCDMAMLILPEVFEQTWGLQIEPFWPAALVRARREMPGMIFLAEAYWGKEEELLRQGFDYAYDKSLYDRLRELAVSPVNNQIRAESRQTGRWAHFLENHDEPRAAAAFNAGNHRAAAVISFFLPGMRFFFSGQLEGHRIRVPIQFCTSPVQEKDISLSQFYDRLLALLKKTSCREDGWVLLQAAPAWDGDAGWSNIIGFTWLGEEGERMLVAVNYSPRASQCFLQLPFSDLQGQATRLEDQMSDQVYLRSGDDLTGRGLYVDLPAWGYHVFRIYPDNEMQGQ